MALTFPPVARKAEVNRHHCPRGKRRREIDNKPLIVKDQRRRPLVRPVVMRTRNVMMPIYWLPSHSIVIEVNEPGYRATPVCLLHASYMCKSVSRNSGLATARPTFLAATENRR